MYRSTDNINLSYLAYRYDGNDNITAIIDQLGPGGSVVYGYDKLDRLNFTLIQSGGAAGTTSNSYSAGTNRLAAGNDASGARTIAYDARGNTSTESRPGGITAAATYDGYGHLTSYSRSDAGGYTPLAVATPDSDGIVQFNWVHGNHLGVPLITTDAAGNPATSQGELPIRWSALQSTAANSWLSFRPFGIARKIEGST